MNSRESWGRYPSAQQDVLQLEAASTSLPKTNGKTLLPYGRGRSYGDSCLNDGGLLLETSALNNFLSFDEDSGVLHCEAGVSLQDILEVFVPRGWFLPVVPGTQLVTVGGAIANDIHGKNHHRAGTFGCHVPSFELLRSDGQLHECSHESNSKLYRATIGGLGLTGLIRSARIQLKTIHGPMIDSESVRFETLNRFFEIDSESETEFEYTVAWIDSLRQRGLYFRGNHSSKTATTNTKSTLSVPSCTPGGLLNRATINAFNSTYYLRQRQAVVKKCVSYLPFFFPLDSIHHWNRLYGPRGFLQYQCVLPSKNEQQALEKVLGVIRAHNIPSFLSVVKRFGDIRSPGMLSFPRPGVTLALDFPNNGNRVFKLLDELDRLVLDNNGAVYPAKDARLSSESFTQFYPQWSEFAELMDPNFSSSFWRRVTK